MEDAYSPPLAAPSEPPQASSRSRLKSAAYWALVIVAMLMIILIWAAQISFFGIGSSISDAHAENESEAGSFIFYLVAKAAQLGLLGWHSMPFALCAAGHLIRRTEDLLKSRLHAVLFWIPVLSFAAALALLFLG